MEDNPVIKTEEARYVDISKNNCVATRKIYKAGNRAIENLPAVVTAGALQRIANSLEKMEIPYNELLTERDVLQLKINRQAADLRAKRSLDPSTYTLQKQVSKLSARLKKAGLDHRPDSDNRKPKK